MFMYSYNGYRVETNKQLSSDTSTLDCPTTSTSSPLTSLAIHPLPHLVQLKVILNHLPPVVLHPLPVMTHHLSQ